ncbi:MAG: TonB-dependent receptor [Opitutaceae bacterium]|nr:TonB-dependent receptor [Opitutaceae bacterium]
MFPWHALASGQGTIRGTIVSADTGAPVAGAAVELDGVPTSVATDLNGEFTLTGVDLGGHTVTVRRDGYRTGVIEGLEVGSDMPARVEAALETVPDDAFVELGELVIAATVAEGSTAGLLSVRQKAPTVSDAISADDLTRLAVGDAAEAMSKITGASVLDGRYVLIRGLGDRYANTLLNNMSVPSADPDKRAVQMDQFPASVLDSIVTSKSFTPDQSGAFTGGSVNMRTKSFPERFFASASMSVTFDDGVAGESVLSVPGGGSDWLARDDGTRALPKGIPAAIPGRTEASNAARFQGDFTKAEELDRVSRLFHNDTYFPGTKDGGMNLGFSLATGDRLDLGQDRLLGYVVSLSYDNATSHYTDGIQGKYAQGGTDPEAASFVNTNLLYTPQIEDLSFAPDYAAYPDVPGGEPAFGVTQTSDDVMWNLYGQIAYKPSLNHEVALRYMQSQSATDTVRRGVGESARSEAGRLFQVYDMLYTERGLQSYQLSGKSLLPDLGEVRVEWRAATSTSTQEQPDYRSLSYFWDFNAQQYAAASGVGNDRYFRDLDEGSREAGVDVYVPVYVRGYPGTLKFGGTVQSGEREYRERGFRWDPPPNTIERIESFPNPVGIVDRTANSVTFGNTISELPNTLLNYDGEQELWGAYGMADLIVAEKWRVIGGARIEGTRIDVGPMSGSSAFAAAAIDQSDVLPAASIVYTLQKDMNLRVAFGRTLARPLYHELAGIRVENRFLDKTRTGNPDLEITTVNNLDLRWEWFRGGTELYAVGVFHKDFTNPIEVLDVAAEGTEKPQNLESARVSGVEFEARFSLGKLSDSLEPFSVGGNLALMASAEKIPEAELAVIRAVYPDAKGTRELFGQSPYVANVDVTYANLRLGTSATLAFNVAGERLVLVTDSAIPDIYEQPAPRLDFVLSQRLGARWRLKFAAKNLLAPDREKSLTHRGTTYYHELYGSSRTFQLGLSYFFE